eukprot:6338097-Amphidinium_carterae.1
MFCPIGTLAMSDKRVHMSAGRAKNFNFGHWLSFWSLQCSTRTSMGSKPFSIQSWHKPHATASAARKGPQLDTTPNSAPGQSLSDWHL